MRRMSWLLIALLVAPVALAQAPAPVAMRVGNHPGYGRIVFDWPRPPAYTLDRGEDAVLLHFPAGAAIDPAGARRPPRNVAAVAVEPGGIRMTLRPGARLRHFRIGPKVVVDVLDPAPAAVAPQSAPVSARPVAAQPAGSVRRLPAAPSLAPAPEPPAQPPVPLLPEIEAAPAASLPRPAALMVRPVAEPTQGRAILLPYGATTGAAILRRGGLLLALFDSAEPLDLAALRNDPVFAGLEAQPLPNATLLRLPLAPPAILRARREPSGWVLEAIHPAQGREVSAAAGERAMTLEAEGSAAVRLVIRAGQPGRVVPVTDPETGMPLLFGTVREAGQRVPVTRRLPELDLPATLLGAAVLARADEVTMQAGTDRFLVGAGGGGLALDFAVTQPGPAEAMTRSFDFPALPSAQLLDRLRALNASIAGAPPLTRLPLRRAAGETLMALGLPQEAQAMLGLAPGEDPRAATDPRLAALVGAAALLAGRLREAMVLQTTAMPETDELTLWRAILAAARGDARAAASGLAATLPLLLDYPEALRARLLPAAAQALAEAGAIVPLKQLLEGAGPVPALALPRAMLAEAEGNAAAALDGYDRVGARPRPAGPGTGLAPGHGTAPGDRADRGRPGRPRAGDDAVRLARRCRGSRGAAAAGGIAARRRRCTRRAGAAAGDRGDVPRPRGAVAASDGRRLPGRLGTGNAAFGRGDVRRLSRTVAGRSAGRGDRADAGGKAGRAGAARSCRGLARAGG